MVLRWSGFASWGYFPISGDIFVVTADGGGGATGI